MDLPRHTTDSEYRNVKPLSKALFGEIVKAEARSGGEAVAIKRLDLRACRAKRTVALPGLALLGGRRSFSVSEDAMFELELMQRFGRVAKLAAHSGTEEARAAAAGCEHLMPLRAAFIDPSCSSGDIGSINSNNYSSSNSISPGDRLSSAAEQLCLVMPLCDGGDLFTQLSSGGAFGQARARRLFRQLIHGVSFLHRHDVAHRDLSLENLLTTTTTTATATTTAAATAATLTDHLIIADLGLAAGVNARKGNACSGKVGKHFYIAPEVFRDDGGLAALPPATAMAAASPSSYDGKAADAWSVGVVLFMMLSGVPPHDRPAVSDERFVYTNEGRLGEMLRCWGMEALFGGGALELVEALMCVDPARRMGLREAMAHPWVVGDGADRLPWEICASSSTQAAASATEGADERMIAAGGEAEGVGVGAEGERRATAESPPSTPELPGEVDDLALSAALAALDHCDGVKPFCL